MALFGPAVVLAAAVVLPGPRPTLDDLTAWLAGPLSLRSLAAAATLAAVLVWAILAAATVTAMIAAATRRTGWLTRLPLPQPAKTALLALAGAAALTGASTTAEAQQPAAATDDHPDLAPDRAHSPAEPGNPPNQGAAAPRSHDRPAAADPGIDLADGSWLPLPLAEAVAAASAAIWWQRRRDYHPLARPAASRDIDLVSPPPTITAATAHLTEADDPAEGVTDPTDRPVEPRRPPLHISDLPSGGLALTGDGGPAAARGILISALLTADTHVHTTTHTLRALLGAQHTPAATRLHITTNLERLIDQLHEHQTGRAVAIVATTPRDDTIPLAQTLRNNHATAIVVGPWPTGPAWDVATDGITFTRDQRSPRRLCVLTETAASDLLALADTDIPAAATPPPTTAPHSDATGPTVAWRTDLRLTLLGDIRLEHHGHTVHIRRVAGWQILSFLAIHPAGATAYQLLTAIWPHLRPHTITGRLYTAVSELRRQLPADPATPVMERDAETYRLNPAHIDVDLWHLTAAHQTASTSPDAGVRRRALHTLIDTYTGDLAANRPWPWLHQPREIIRRHALDAYATLGAQAPPADAIELLKRASSVDPVNQQLARTIEALARLE